MKTQEFTKTIVVDQTPHQVFNAIQNVNGWWSEEIEGSTAKLNDVFNYHFEDLHRCRLKLVEMVPDKKLVWLVLDNYFKPGIFEEKPGAGQSPAALIDGKNEWTGTKISFEISEKDGRTEIRFAHLGLIPEFECFEVCTNSWTHYIQESLRDLITTGTGRPNKTGRPMTKDEEKFHSDSVAG